MTVSSSRVTLHNDDTYPGGGVPTTCDKYVNGRMEVHGIDGTKVTMVVTNHLQNTTHIEQCQTWHNVMAETGIFHLKCGINRY